MISYFYSSFNSTAARIPSGSGKMSYCDCAGYLLTNDPQGKHEVTSGDPMFFFLAETLIVVCPASSDTNVLCSDSTSVCCSHRTPRVVVSTGLLSRSSLITPCTGNARMHNHAQLDFKMKKKCKCLEVYVLSIYYVLRRFSSIAPKTFPCSSPLP